MTAHEVKSISDYWDHISEYEIDPSWKQGLTREYHEYRKQFELAQQRKYSGKFPLSMEIEASYHCNLECPFCPRSVNENERDIRHMSEEMWRKILEESKRRGLCAMLMDHEAESLMNPRIFEMIREARDAGIMDVWLHTNGNLLTPELSEKLIDSGLTKINFSLDACREHTYEILRVGGNYKKVIKNIQDFLAIKIRKEAFYLRTRVSFVVQKANLEEKKEFFDFWKNQVGINLIAFQGIFDIKFFEQPDQDWKMSEKELEKKYGAEEPFICGKPWETTVIDVDGNIIPCGSPVREHTKDFILGNLNNGDTVESCWNGEKMSALKELHNRGEWYKNPMCRNCVKSLRSSKNL